VCASYSTWKPLDETKDCFVTLSDGRVNTCSIATDYKYVGKLSPILLLVGFSALSFAFQILPAATSGMWRTYRLNCESGLQPLRWIGRRDLSLADLIVQPQLQPVRIAAGALGAGLPARNLLVSPQHRMLVQGARAELLFGDAEVLVAATHLTGLAQVATVLTPGVTYIHLLFDAHELIEAEGAWTESFQPATRTCDALDEAQRAEIAALFPEFDQGIDYPAARLTLKRYEARVLLEV
jgi:hypothetical protein